jgi:hypothetical protein
MAGFSDQTEADILNLWLAAKNISTGIATASTTYSQLWASLHTGDPGDAGTQGISEAAYTGYTRIAIARSTTGWACSTSQGSANPVANIDFPQNTSTSTGTITYAAIGLTSASTAGQIVASGQVSPSINYSQSVQPRLTTGSSFTLD